MNGGLWKGMVQTWSDGGALRTPGSSAGAENEPPRMTSIALFDMQLAHVTRCQLPSAAAATEPGWHFNLGSSGDTTEEQFTVSGLIARAR